MTHVFPFPLLCSWEVVASELENNNGRAGKNGSIEPVKEDEKPAVSDPETLANLPSVLMTSTAYKDAMDYLMSREPEAGGMLLGPKGHELITHFIPDPHAEASIVSYTPNAEWLNQVLRKFLACACDAKGIIHSHPGFCTSPSQGDLAHVRNTFARARTLPPISTFCPSSVTRCCIRTCLRVTSPSASSWPNSSSSNPCFRLSRGAGPPNSEKPFMLDFSRIQSVIDVDAMQNASVTIVGGGGGANLARNLIRCGLGTIRLVDFDHIELVNICRQEHMHDSIGMPKVEALANELYRINPAVTVETFPRNFCSFSDEEIDANFGDSNAFIFCVDNLEANARGNEVALRLRKPSVYSAVYPRGQAGEVVFWHDDLRLPCYRCLCSARYRGSQTGCHRSQS